MFRKKNIKDKQTWHLQNSPSPANLEKYIQTSEISSKAPAAQIKARQNVKNK